MGKLTVAEQTTERKSRYTVWLCRCSLCEKEIEVSAPQLVMGYTKSCGNHDKTMVDEGLVDGTSIRKLEYYMTQRFPLTKSGYTGVWQEKKSGKWVAEMQLQGKKILNRRFARKEEAIAARKKAEEEVASYLETFYLMHPEWNRAYYQTRSRKLRQTTVEKPFRAQKERQDHGKAERQDDVSEAQRTEQGRP